MKWLRTEVWAGLGDLWQRDCWTGPVATEGYKHNPKCGSGGDRKEITNFSVLSTSKFPLVLPIDQLKWESTGKETLYRNKWNSVSHEHVLAHVRHMNESCTSWKRQKPVEKTQHTLENNKPQICVGLPYGATIIQCQ